MGVDNVDYNFSDIYPLLFCNIFIVCSYNQKLTAETSEACNEKTCTIQYKQTI